MRNKVVYFDEESKQKVAKGIDKLARAVTVTLGAGGKNVLMERKYMTPQVTKDGVTVAKEINLRDRLENIGVQVVKEAAVKTVENAGDGTTTAVLLASEIVKGAFKAISSGSNSMQISTGLEKGYQEIKKYLQMQAKPIDDNESIRKVALISANGDKEIADNITEVMNKVGKKGIITIEEGAALGIQTKYVEGMQIDSGFIHNAFINNVKDLTAEVKDAAILVTDYKISGITQIVNIFNAAFEANLKNLLVIAEDVSGEALATMILNKVQGNANFIAIKAPGFGTRRKELLKDIAISTGAKVISKENGDTLENMKIEDLGRAAKVITGKNLTVIVEGKGNKEELNKRIEQLEAESRTEQSEYEVTLLQERIAKLQNGVAVIQIGAVTEIELRERKDRLDDALQATRAAVEEGIVAGGGVALMDCKPALANKENLVGDEVVAYSILESVIQSPIRKIVSNAGGSDQVVLSHSGNGFGYDVRTGKVVDMIENGVIDPVKVTRLALENAISVARMLITAEVFITDDDEQEEKDETSK